MEIFVIMKRTFDTEEKIMIQNGEIKDDSVEFIINPYDEYAIEEAIKLREKHGGKVTVLSSWRTRNRKTIKNRTCHGRR